jgi:hypothetical protein
VRGGDPARFHPAWRRQLPCPARRCRRQRRRRRRQHRRRRRHRGGAASADPHRGPAAPAPLRGHHPSPPLIGATRGAAGGAGPAAGVRSEEGEVSRLCGAVQQASRSAADALPAALYRLPSPTPATLAGGPPRSSAGRFAQRTSRARGPTGPPARKQTSRDSTVPEARCGRREED